MHDTNRLALSCAGLLALAGAQCATSRAASESPDPNTRQIALSQQRTEEALQRAHEMQKAASEQAQRAAAAQEQVRADQQRLAEDQQKAREEQAKAQQMQAQARRELDQASQEAKRDQRSASLGLSQTTRQAGEGKQSASGVVTRVRPDEIVVQPPSGSPLTLSVNGATQVQIDGRRASVKEIKPGADARVSFEPSGDGAKAISVQIGRAPATQGTGSSPSR